LDGEIVNHDEGEEITITYTSLLSSCRDRQEKLRYLDCSRSLEYMYFSHE
jgi:hypothetical protein